MAEYTLLIILFAPFVGALALIFVSNRQLSLVRGIAAGSAFVSLIASVYLFYAYDPLKGGYQFIQRMESAPRWSWPPASSSSPAFSSPGTSKTGSKSFTSGF